MKIFYVIWGIWVGSELLLAGFKRAEISVDNHDKSSLKIIWGTILISIFIGTHFNYTNFPISQRGTSFVSNSGNVLIILGLIIRWIAIFKLRKSFTVNLAVTDEQTIIQSGIYKNIRHPSYTGSLISFFGLGLVFNNWITLAIIFIPIFMAFFNRLKIEENLLLKTFGNKYEDYMKRSWRLIPGIF